MSSAHPNGGMSCFDSQDGGDVGSESLLTHRSEDLSSGPNGFCRLNFYFDDTLKGHSFLHACLCSMVKNKTEDWNSPAAQSETRDS